MASDTNSCGASNPAFEMVSQIMIDIKKEPQDLNTSKLKIYRVPCNLRMLNEEAYTPQLISIGPIHYGQEKLNPMQLQKLRYFHLFWVRVNSINVEAMNKFKGFLEENEADIRDSYAEKFPDMITKEKLVDMMLLDAVFIMELFLRIQGNNTSEEDNDDIILKQTWLNKSIQRDLLLLENQIPLFILDELYDKVVPDKKRLRFIELAHDYFECFHPYKKSNSCFDEFEKTDLDCKPHSGSGFQKKPSSRFELLRENWNWNKTEPIHFTDLIRYFYLCKDLTHRQKGLTCNVLRTATKLQEAGVSFKKVINRPLLDIKFVKVPILSWFLCLGCIPYFTYFKPRLQIPQLQVDDTTECVLRNLIAFEQCHYPAQPYICNYVFLIDSLIHTKDDVELLVEKEVIIHELGSDNEVATLVNGLCKHVVIDQTCYKEIIDDLNKHYQSQWNRTMAALRLVYFRDTWRASSTVVGIAVLIFAVFNFCRVLQSVLTGNQPSLL